MRVQKEKNRKSKTLIERDRALINKALKGYLAGAESPALLSRAMRYAVLSGGKRLRAILTLESSRALGGDIKKAIPFACAIELAHNFSLVHDDLPAMDDDDTRRGKPSCHKKFGEALAILAGDGLLNLAFAIISKTKTGEALGAISILSEAIGAGNMIGGQALDMACKDSPAKERRLKGRINAMKTAALMAASCKIGAFLAGGKKRETEKIYAYGKNLGRAFQIADDLADCRLPKAASCKMKKNAKLLLSKAKREIEDLDKKAETLSYIADKINAKLA